MANRIRKDIYVYVYLDPRKPGIFRYDGYEFDHEPIYVGKGRRHRIRDHICYVKQRKPRTKNKLKYSKIRKILDANLEPIIFKMAKNLVNKEAIKMERKLIECIGRIDLETGPLTNLTGGGEGTHGYTFSPEQRKNLSQIHTGKKLTDEHKKNIGLATKRRWSNPEYKARLSEKYKGRKPSKEATRKRVETFIARGHGKWMKGRKLPISTKRKMSMAQSTLTENQILEIRRLFDTGDYTQAKLSDMFQVSATVIHCIVRRKTWRYI